MSEPVRIDKWLWFARFLKSRSLATALVASGRLRINGQPIQKAHYLVKVGDVLTFPLGPHIRVIEVLAQGVRRGPAPEAQTLYQDLEPPQPRPPAHCPMSVRPRKRPCWTASPLRWRHETAHRRRR